MRCTDTSPRLTLIQCPNCDRDSLLSLVVSTNLIGEKEGYPATQRKFAVITQNCNCEYRIYECVQTSPLVGFGEDWEYSYLDSELKRSQAGLLGLDGQ